MKKNRFASSLALLLGGTAAACAACCALPLLVPLLGGLAVASGLSMAPWAVVVAAAAGVGALLSWVRWRRKRQRAARCGCAGGCDATD